MMTDLNVDGTECMVTPLSVARACARDFVQSLLQLQLTMPSACTRSSFNNNGNRHRGIVPSPVFGSMIVQGLPLAHCFGCDLCCVALCCTLRCSCSFSDDSVNQEPWLNLVAVYHPVFSSISLHIISELFRSSTYLPACRYVIIEANLAVAWHSNLMGPAQ